MKCSKLSARSFLLIILSLIFCNCEIVEAEQQEENVSFRWVLGATVGPKDDPQVTAITGDTVLKTGDQLKFCVELEKKCFVYLIYQSADGDIDLIFPLHLEQFATDYTTAKQYCTPPSDSWFEFDEKPGLETFYLLGSATRLNELEDLFRTPQADGITEKKKRAQNLLAQIRTLQKRHRTLTASAERPVSIGGNVRGISKGTNTELLENDAIAVEVSATNFYSRSFTIEHR